MLSCENCRQDLFIYMRQLLELGFHLIIIFTPYSLNQPLSKTDRRPKAPKALCLQGKSDYPLK